MKRLFRSLRFRSLALAAALVPIAAAQQTSPFAGRWDLTVTTPRATYPDWMMVEMTASGPRARIQPRSGGSVWATDVSLQGSHLTLHLRQAAWDLTVDADKIAGTIKQGDTVQGQIAGVRAPEMKRPMPAAWTDPEPLFNGKDLTGWEPLTPANNHWVVKDGELVNQGHGANLKSTRKFDDFKLHIEFNCPDQGNSGIYLRGRYEVQIEYEPAGTEDRFHMMGSVYSFLAPQADVPRKPGEWESFDITLVGRMVSITRDGIRIMDRAEIPGITGGALDSDEGQPGQIYFQGDHTGGMKFRNITISVPKSGSSK